MAYQELAYIKESGVKSGLACVYGRNLADLTKGMRGRERGSAGCSVCEFVSPRSSSIGPRNLRDQVLSTLAVDCVRLRCPVNRAAELQR